MPYRILEVNVGMPGRGRKGKRKGERKERKKAKRGRMYAFHKLLAHEGTGGVKGWGFTMTCSFHNLLGRWVNGRTGCYGGASSDVW